MRTITRPNEPGMTQLTGMNRAIEIILAYAFIPEYDGVF